MLRFYDPQQGKIELSGIDIRNCKLQELRSGVAMVTQNIEIMEGTVRDNLALFDESIQDEDIIDVLKELGLQEWYAALPDGLDTVLASGEAACRQGKRNCSRLPGCS